MNFKHLAVASTAALSIAGAANAAVVSLNFEGVNATYPSGFAQVLDFYNGGLSSDGTTGTDYGISFSSEALAICLNSDTVSCSNTTRGGLAPGSDKGGLFFLSGSETILTMASGFDTGFSFFYSQIQPNNGIIKVFDDVNGTGNLLASFNLPTTPSGCPGYPGAYCPFVAQGVSFAGIGKSVSFGGVANYVVFDDITFGSATPVITGGVPEPSTWAMAILGMGLAGATLRRARRQRAVTA